MTAGTPAVPYGVNGTLTIHLYGKDQGTAGKGGTGITCASSSACGVPTVLWNSNSAMKLNPADCTRAINVGDTTRIFPAMWTTVSTPTNR